MMPEVKIYFKFTGDILLLILNLGFYTVNSVRCSRPAESAGATFILSLSHLWRTTVYGQILSRCSLWTCTPDAPLHRVAPSRRHKVSAIALYQWHVGFSPDGILRARIETAGVGRRRVVF